MHLALLWDLPAACALLTRLPLPRLPGSAFDAPARATWAYPVVGGIVGLCGFVAWHVAAAIAGPPVISAIAAVAAMTLVTGGLHEDGLADSADGLWGASNRERRLEIMRDSRIGSYGVLALIFTILLRIAALTFAGPAALFLAAILSRAPLPALMAAMPHARTDGLSHGIGAPPFASVLTAAGIGVFVSIIFFGGGGLLACILASGCVAIIAARKIGGQTGDILGAAQQLAEVSILLTLI